MNISDIVDAADGQQIKVGNLNMDPEKMKDQMITVAKKVLDITDEEVDALVEELSQMYPAGYAEYYAGCICAMQERMRML